MVFSHAQSKINLKLRTTETADAVDLTKVKSVQLEGTALEGTMSLHDKSIVLDETTVATNLAIAVDGIATTTINNRRTMVVVPQVFTEDAIVRIIMEDNSTYSLKLKNIDIQLSENNIAKHTGWVAGESYEYVIVLRKSILEYTATLVDWVEKAGSGDANMDWD